MKRSTVLPPGILFNLTTDTQSQTSPHLNSRNETSEHQRTCEWIFPFGIRRICRFLFPLSVALVFVMVVILAQVSHAQAPNGTIPTTFFGQTLVNPGSTYPTVPVGNMGKESAAEWSYIEQTAPSGSGCPGTVNCTHTYNWSMLDTYLSTATAHGVPFMFFFTEAPPWATNGVDCRSIPPGQACRGPVVPDHTLDQQAFVTALVNRYNGGSHGYIGSYELGNETDYAGTPAQYAAQSDRIVKAIKAVNPSALIVGMGWAQPDGYYQSGGAFDQMWAAWKAIPGNSAHLDVVSYHGYPHTANVVPEIVISGAGASGGQGSCASTGFVPCVKAAIARDSVTNFSGGTPKVWDTEGSWGTNSGYSGSQPAFIGRFLLLSWAAGTSQQAWYSWDNSQWGSISGNSANITAYQQVHNWMIGSTMVSPCALAAGSTWTCTLGNSGSTYEAVWNTSGSTSFTIPAGAWTSYRDLSGAEKSISGSDTTVSIGTLPILLVGSGSPVAPPTGLTATTH
jgi:hypothetical protein